MSSDKSNSLLRNSFSRIIVITGLILSIPFIAMQFSEEVDWGPFDFIVIGALLVTTGLVYEFIVRKLKNKNHKIIASIALGLGLLMVYAELAVGIFNSPLSGS